MKTKKKFRWSSRGGKITKVSINWKTSQAFLSVLHTNDQSQNEVLMVNRNIFNTFKLPPSEDKSNKV